jgi:hypothetical protein
LIERLEDGGERGLQGVWTTRAREVYRNYREREREREMLTGSLDNEGVERDQGRPMFP